MKIIFNFTLNKIGGFDFGDGEYFDSPNIKDADFFVRARETKHKFKLYLYPNKIYEKCVLEKWDCPEWIEIATTKSVITYEKKKLTQHFQDLLSGKTKSTSIYNPASCDGESFTIDDFWFYFANDCECNTKLTNITSPCKPTQ